MHQIYIQNWWGDPPPTSLGTQGSKPPRPSSFYIPRAPALLHLHLALQGVPSPSPLGTQESRLSGRAPSATQAPTFECIWRGKNDRVGGEDGGVPVGKHPTLLQVFLQVGEEGLGVGLFKKEGKGLKPQRGDFPSWTPEGARALRGLKDRAGAGCGGAGGPRRGQGPRKSGSRSEAAAVTSLCHRLRLLGGWGGGGRGRSEDGGARGSGQAGAWGAERKERGEAVKGPEAGAVGSPVPAGPPAPAPSPPGPAGLRPAADLRGSGLTFLLLLLLRSLLFWKGGGGREGRVRSPAGGAAGRAERAREGRRNPGGGTRGRRVTPLSSRLPRACPQAAEARPLPTHLRAAP